MLEGSRKAGKPMKPFTLLIKPVSFDCNLRCEYCFYLRAEEVYGAGRHRMADDVLGEMIKQMMGYGFPETVFGWQGGEPTVAGLDFFRRVIEFQKKYGKTGQVVGNALQTNATLIDEDWARFLAEYHWLVGVSIDGPREIHNRYRKKAGGGETFHAALRGLKELRKANVAVNALALVSKANVKRARQVYDFVRGQKFDFIQFIPCVEADPRTGKPAPFAVTGEEFGDFLCEVFDAWKIDGPGKVSVRYFDAVRRYLLDGGHDLCVMAKRCDAYLLVEYNGDVYPCDFFMYDEWRLGNLMETPLCEIGETPLRKKFAAMKAAGLAACADCEWIGFCHGGCPKDRQAFGDPRETATPLCAAYRKFLPHAVPFFRELDAKLKRERVEARKKPEIAAKDETG